MLTSMKCMICYLQLSSSCWFQYGTSFNPIWILNFKAICFLLIPMHWVFFVIYRSDRRKQSTQKSSDTWVYDIKNVTDCCLLLLFLYLHFINIYSHVGQLKWQHFRRQTTNKDLLLYTADSTPKSCDGPLWHATVLCGMWQSVVSCDSFFCNMWQFFVTCDSPLWHVTVFVTCDSPLRYVTVFLFIVWHVFLIAFKLDYCSPICRF